MNNDLTILALLLAVAWTIVAIVGFKSLGFLDIISKVIIISAVISALSWGIITSALQNIVLEPEWLRYWSPRISLFTKLMTPIGFAWVFYQIGKYIRRYT